MKIGILSSGVPATPVKYHKYLPVIGGLFEASFLS